MQQSAEAMRQGSAESRGRRGNTATAADPVEQARSQVGPQQELARALDKIGDKLAAGTGTQDAELRKLSEQLARAQELRKYPPARRLLAIPGHRRLLWWYVGRASILIPLADCATTEGADRVTLTVIADGLPSILTLDPSADPSADELPVPAGVEGPACVLFHEEDDQMADLRQLALHGTVRDGVFRVERRAGSLAPGRPSTLSQLKTLRSLARQARKKRPVFERWTRSAEGPAASPRL